MITQRSLHTSVGNQVVRIEAICLCNQLLHANVNGVLQLDQDHLIPNPLKVTTHQAPKHRLYNWLQWYNPQKNHTFHVLTLRLPNLFLNFSTSYM
jgi:hypothetical protein